MTVRRLMWALYWAAVLVAASVASLAAAIPFTGPAANAAGVFAAAGVSLVGLACAPHPGGAR